MVQPYQAQVSFACRCHSRCRMYPASKSTVSPSWGRKIEMRAYGSPSRAAGSVQLRSRSITWQVIGAEDHRSAITAAVLLDSAEMFRGRRPALAARSIAFAMQTTIARADPVVATHPRLLLTAAEKTRL